MTQNRKLNRFEFFSDEEAFHDQTRTEFSLKAFAVNMRTGEKGFQTL